MSHALERFAAAARERTGERSQPGDGEVEGLRDAHARASEVVAGIAADAAANPEPYLRATVVPEGGE